jgi:general secretion pathway protein J
MNDKRLGQQMALHRGFTLLEVLVAVAIFAVLGMLAMTGYNQLAQQSDRLGESMKRTRAVQMTIMRMTQDFAELEPRPIREPIGSGSQAALRADGRTAALAELTRAGWNNPAGIQRPTLQRVAYRFENGKLFRDHWLVLDRTLASEPVAVELLDNVRNVRFRFMDLNRAWQEQWPAANLSGPASAPVTSSDRPLAVEVTLELEDWGALTRLIEVPG